MDDVKILLEAIVVFVPRVMSSTVGPRDAKVGNAASTELPSTRLRAHDVVSERFYNV